MSEWIVRGPVIPLLYAETLLMWTSLAASRTAAWAPQPSSSPFSEMPKKSMIC